MNVIALLFSEVVLSHLSEFLSRPYVIEACLVPFFLDITFSSQQAPRSLEKLNFVCDSLVLFLQVSYEIMSSYKLIHIKLKFCINIFKM